MPPFGRRVCARYGVKLAWETWPKGALRPMWLRTAVSFLLSANGCSGDVGGSGQLVSFAHRSFIAKLGRFEASERKVGGHGMPPHFTPDRILNLGCPAGWGTAGQHVSFAH